MPQEIVGDQRVILIGVESEPDATTGETTLEYIALENETSNSRSSENESVEVNSKGSLHAKSLVGIASDTMSLEAYAHGDLTIAQAQSRLMTARKRRELVYVEYGARDVATGEITPIEYNYGNVTSVEDEAGMDEAITLSMEIELQDFWSEEDYFLTLAAA